jgi:hypothetical protein
MPQFEDFHTITINANQKERTFRVFYGTVRLSTGSFHTGLCCEFSKNGKPYTTAITEVDADEMAKILQAGAAYARGQEPPQ